jgi:hypothetical protein
LEARVISGQNSNILIKNSTSIAEAGNEKLNTSIRESQTQQDIFDKQRDSGTKMLPT